MNGLRWLLGSIFLVSATGFVCWWAQPDNCDGWVSSSPNTRKLQHFQAVPTIAEGEVADVLLPQAGEKQSVALEIADRITREGIQLSRAEARELMDFVRSSKPASLSDGE
jgi:hypothetical protein